MADNKKYYYLKLKDNFYDTDEMIILQDEKDGYLYSDILMKLYLRSLKNDGRLMFKDRIPYNPEMLSTIVRHSVGVVKEALHLFHKLDLIEILDNGAIYMLDIQNFIGQSSTEADRKRTYRQEIESEKKNLLPENNQIGTFVRQTSDINPPELELDLDLDLELELKKFLSNLKTIKDYPFNKETDTKLYNTLQERHPKVDLVKMIEAYQSYKLDNPLEKNSNPRSQINTQCINAVKWKKHLKETSSSKQYKYKD